MNPRTLPKRQLLYGVSGLVLVVIVALLVGYGLKIWPQQKNSTSSSQEKAVVTSGNVKSEAAVPVKAVDTKGVPEDAKDVKVLQTYVRIDTKEQGDCTLTLSRNGKAMQTFTSSTKDIEGATGCLQWNVSTEGMEKGVYDMTVEFKGTNDNATVRQKVTI
jgi:hypothetical protein